MALIFKVVSFCIIGWVAVQAGNVGDESSNPSIWTPRRPIPPTPVQLPEWMMTGVFPTFPTAPVAPTPVRLPEWMTSGRFPTPAPVVLPDWMSTGVLPIMPNQPDLTSGSVVNTKPGDHLQYNGVAVRSSNDGSSMATNDNGKVKLAKDGSAPPDLNKPLPSMDPKARFSSFSSSSVSSSKTVDGKTVTVGSSDTKVNNDGKIDAESVHVVQEDKASGWKGAPLDEDETDSEDEASIEDISLDEVATIEDDVNESSDDEELSNEEESPSNTASSASSSSSSSSTSSSSTDGGKPKFASSSISSFSSSSDKNGVQDKASGSSVVVNDNGKVLAKKTANSEKLDTKKKGPNSIEWEDKKKVIPLSKVENDSESDEVATIKGADNNSSDEVESPKADSKTFSSSTSSSTSSSSSSSSKDGEKPEFTSSSISSFSSSTDKDGVKDKVSGSSVVVNDNGKVVAKKALNREKLDANKKERN